MRFQMTLSTFSSLYFVNLIATPRAPDQVGSSRSSVLHQCCFLCHSTPSKCDHNRTPDDGGYDRHWASSLSHSMMPGDILMFTSPVLFRKHVNFTQPNASIFGNASFSAHWKEQGGTWGSRSFSQLGCSLWLSAHSSII